MLKSLLTNATEKTWWDRLAQAKRDTLASKDVALIGADVVQVLAGEKLEGEKTGPRRFEMVAYTGTDIGRYWGRMIVDLQGIESAEKTAMLFEHDDRLAAGVCDERKVDARGLVLRGPMLDNEVASEICKNADQGFPYRASIGIRFITTEELAEGAKATVNGREVCGPMTIVRKCHLFETSFITCNPADLATSVEIASAQLHTSTAPENSPMDRKALLALIEANPELKAELLAAGATAERSDRAERAVTFAEAFPKHPKFRARMLDAGKSLLEAKAEFSEILLKEIARGNGKKADGSRLTSSEKRQLNRVEERAAGSRGDRTPGLGFDGRGRQDGNSETFSSFDHLEPIERAAKLCARDPNLAKLFRDYADPGVEKLLANSFTMEKRLRPNEQPLLSPRLLQLTSDEIRQYADPRWGPINDDRLGSFGKSGPDYTAITVKGFLAYFFRRFEQELSGIWAPMIALRVESNQETEIHRWLGLFPQLSEWLGGVREDQLPTYQFAITNKLYRASIGVDKNDYKSQKFGLISMRIGEAGAVAAEHWCKLISDLIAANGTAYDGKAFFATNHTLGGLSGMNNLGPGSSMTNDLSKTDYGVLNPADPSNPTAQEHVDIAMSLASHMRRYLDSNGEPMNGGARRFIYMVPAQMEGRAVQGMKAARLNFGADNALAVQENAFQVVANPRLTGTNIVYLFREDCTNKAFILQEPGAPELLFQGPGSYLEWAQHKYGFGIESTRAAGYGGWESAVRATLG